MGLDTVELLLNVEECFGVAITDESAAQLTTPRQLSSHIAKLLATQSPERNTAKTSLCLSQRAFYRLRRALMAETGLSRNALRPDTPLAEVFPDQRRATWRRLQRALAAPDLPRLTASPPISALLQIGGPSLFVLLAARQSGLSLEQVDPDAHFIHDIGLD